MIKTSRRLQVRGLQPGQPFNPFGLFNGIFIPELLVRAGGVSPGAKLAYGRLARYAGQDGNCYPAVATLGAEIGVGERQAQKYLAELERAKLIRRVRRFSDHHGQTSNAFEFLWHRLFEDGVKNRSGEGVNDNSPPGANDRSPKESQIEESQSEESQNCDLDYPPTNRKNRDSRLDSRSHATEDQKYPQLREILADYMMLPDDEERVYPSNRLLVDVMDAARGASEEEVVHCLRYLYSERRLRPGTKHGPRHFSWFKTVVADYFRQKWERSNPAVPACRDGETPAGLSKAEFEFMTGAIEIEGL